LDVQDFLFLPLAVSCKKHLDMLLYIADWYFLAYYSNVLSELHTHSFAMQIVLTFTAHLSRVAITSGVDDKDKWEEYKFIMTFELFNFANCLIFTVSSFLAAFNVL